MNDCLFCKIVKGEIPCSKVYENSNVLAFLDIGPVNKGHTLVIPKKHVVNIFDIDENSLIEVSKVTKKIAPIIKKAVNADGINITTNNGQAAGQVVMHSHTHIIPRFNDDGHKHWGSGKYNEGEMEEVKEKISSMISL
jgi:histidine triad (HIT) family protein